MSNKLQPSREELKQTVDSFWETIPPFWYHVRAHIREVAVPQFGIPVEQFHILRHIRRGRGSVSELAKAKGISRAAISQTVDVLVNKGLISRSQDQRDRRHVQLYLTANGNALLDAIFENTGRWLMRMLSPLSDKELKTLLVAMESLKKVLSA